MIHLKTPLREKDICGLGVGDFVYLSGIVATARDKAHMKALDEGVFPVDVEDGVVFHAGPIVQKEDGGWRVVAIGPTTSARMNRFEPGFIDRFRVKAVIGKGGMDKEIFRGRGVIYLAMTGGCAALGAQAVKEVVGVQWLDLGVPEAVWVLKVEDLGPLLVAIDSQGNSIYDREG